MYCFIIYFFCLAICIRDFSITNHIPLFYVIYYEIHGTPQYKCCEIYLTMLIDIQDVFQVLMITKDAMMNVFVHLYL